MDPNAALTELRAATTAVTQALETYDRSAGALDKADVLASEAGELIDRLNGLLAWLDAGGFLPTAWQAARAEATAGGHHPFFEGQ